MIIRLHRQVQPFLIGYLCASVSCASLSAEHRTSISLCVVKREKLILTAPSMTSVGSFIASRTWLLPPFLQAELRET